MKIRNMMMAAALVSLFAPVSPSHANGPDASRRPTKVKPVAARITSTRRSLPAVELLATRSIAGDEVDLSGLESLLEDGSPVNQFGGLSAIEYTGSGDEFLLLADRGAGDGAVSFPCRFHRAELSLNLNSRTIDWKLRETRFLVSANGSPLVGSFEAWKADQTISPQAQWLAFDPESIRRWGRNQFLVGDEYGPRLTVFDKTGKLNREWTLPANHQVCDLMAPHAADEKLRGAAFNRGLEGLAVSEDGQQVWASFQSSLVQDGVIDLKNGWCDGDFSRLMKFDASGKCVKEIAYPLESHRTGISEILWLDQDRLLVIERDGMVGTQTRCKSIFVADLSGASDVSGLPNVPKKEDLGDLRLVRKTPLIDLLDPRFGIGNGADSEKPEGLSWGKPLPDGRRTLWVCWDNDFGSANRTWIACYAINLPSDSAQAVIATNL